MRAFYGLNEKGTIIYLCQANDIREAEQKVLKGQYPEASYIFDRRQLKDWQEQIISILEDEES